MGYTKTALSTFDSTVRALVICDGELYAAVRVGATPGVHHWNGSTWDRILTGRATSLAVIGTTLYAALSGTGVYEYVSGSTWTDLGAAASTDTAICAFGGTLYVDGSGSNVMRWDGGTTWTSVGDPGAKYWGVTCLAVHDGSLYAGTFGSTVAGQEAHVHQYVSGTTWTDLGRPGTAYCIGSLATFDGSLYAGSGHPDSGAVDDGHAYQFVSGTTWTDLGQLPSCTAAYALAAYNSTLYAGGWSGDDTNVLFAKGSWDSIGTLNAETGVSALWGAADALYAGGYDGSVYKIEYAADAAPTGAGDGPGMRQYRPGVKLEGQEDGEASVRLVQTLAEDLNNYVKYAGRPHLIAEMLPEGINSPKSTTETVILPPFAVQVPWCYSKLLWQIRHFQRSGSATATTWKLYTMDRMYRGPLDLQTATSTTYQVSTLSTTDTVPDYSPAAYTSVVGVRDPLVGSLVWCLLTAVDEDSSTQAAITQLDIWAVP